MAAGGIIDSYLNIPKGAESIKAKLGSTITIPCYLSQFSDVPTDIKWYKETALVCHYKNTQLKKGRLYADRVGQFTEEINTGNVSLSLKDFKESDFGDYLCQVTCGDRTKEITIRVEDLTKKKKERDMMLAAVAGVALVVPGIGLVAGVINGLITAAAAAAGAGAAAAAAAAGVVIIMYHIYFIEIQRQWSEQERQTMERDLLLTVRRSSNDLVHPEMSGET